MTPRTFAAELTALAHEQWDAEGWDEHVAGHLPADADAEWMFHAARHLEATRQELEKAEAALERRRLADVVENGPIRLNDTWVTYGPKTTRTLHDPDALIRWLDTVAFTLETDSLIPAVWRLGADNLRITTLREVAARFYRAQEPGDTSEEAAAEFAKTVEATFVETTREEAGKLQETPIDKAPKYAQRMEHGHRAGTFTNKRRTA